MPDKTLTSMYNVIIIILCQNTSSYGTVVTFIKHKFKTTTRLVAKINFIKTRDTVTTEQIKTDSYLRPLAVHIYRPYIIIFVHVDTY